MHDHEKQVPIWFFIGLLLAVYGLIITAYGVASLNWPKPEAMPEQIHRLHAPVWWGAMMVALGLFYVIKFRPGKAETLTGR